MIRLIEKGLMLDNPIAVESPAAAPPLWSRPRARDMVGAAPMPSAKERR